MSRVSSASEALRMTKNAAEKVVRSREPQPRKDGLHKKALVIGGGIAGIRAALNIANAGFPVVLVERKPTLGGHMAQLSRIFPTMDLAAHVLTPLMKEVGNHPHIRLLTLSEVIDVKGHLGNFHIRIKKNPRYVYPDRCDLCKGHPSARCAEVCPVTVLSEFDEGLTLRKAIYIPFPQAVPSAYTIDKDVCISCGKCAQPDVCSPGAVNLADEEEIIEEDVGVLIIATGYELYGQENIEKYEVEECPDVVTSLQFERLLSPEGPTEGTPKRPSDGKTPKKIVFINCAETRDKKHMPYFSDICCAYLAKQAVIFKKQVPDGEIYFLNINDKVEEENYQDFIKRAQEKAKVNYIRAEVSRIYEQNGKVKILCMNHLRKSVEIEVDMAVIALPMGPSHGVKDLADQLGIKVDKYGFLSAESTTPGIFIAGCAQTPMDIQRTLAQAGVAASKALEILAQMEKA